MKIKTREELGKGNEIDVMLEGLLPRYMALNKSIGNDLAEKLEEEKGMMTGVTSSIVTGMIETTELSEVEELGSFIKGLYEIGLQYAKQGLVDLPEIEKLNPELYYDEEELKMIDRYIKLHEKDDNIIAINNVMKVADNHYVCPMIEWKQLVDYYNRGLINYNIATQRETIKKEKKGVLYQKININQKSVDEIASSYKTGFFIPNIVSLNVRDNGFEQMEDNNVKVGEMTTLKIQVGGKSYCDIIDGAHRLKGALKLIKDNPNAKNFTLLNIFHMTEDRALDYIVQEDKRNEMSKSHIDRIRHDNIGIVIAKELNVISNNKLQGKISEDIIELKSLNKYVDVLTLGNAINLWFTGLEDSPMKVRKVKKYLVDFFNFVIEGHSNYFNKKNLDQKDIFQRNNIFVGFIGLAEKLYDVENWEDELINILEKVDIKQMLHLVSGKKMLKPNDVRKIGNDFRNFSSTINKEVAVTNG